jgi:3-oxoacyl-[acyl-carrier protein] reductase
MSLAREGVNVILNGRRVDKLEAAAAEIRRLSAGNVRYVAADLNSESGRRRLLEAGPEPDMLINNNAGPPPGDISEWDRDAWIAAFDANMIPAALLIREVLPGMRNRKFGRIVNITSAMVRTPRPAMGLSTAARTALTAFCKAITAEAAPDNVTINNLLPERIDTPRQEFMAQGLMEQRGITHEEARQQIASSVAARRLGLPTEFGDACAFLCSAQAGFISGTNLSVDGGSYPGLL